MRNDGKKIEAHFIKESAAAYAKRRQLYLVKADPPTFIVRGKIMYRRSPYLDFNGCWIERDGRRIEIEVKSTKKPVLPLFRESGGGLEMHQWEGMRIWHHAGAAVALLWFYNGECAFLNYWKLRDHQRTGRKSIRWDEVEKVRESDGVKFDFLPMLRQSYDLPF